MNKKRVALALAAALGINTLMVTVGQVGGQAVIAHAQNARLTNENDIKKLGTINIKTLETTVENVTGSDVTLTFKGLSDENVKNVTGTLTYTRFAERTGDSNGNVSVTWDAGKAKASGLNAPGIYSGDITIEYKDGTKEVYTITLKKVYEQEVLSANVEVGIGKIVVSNVTLGTKSIIPSADETIELQLNGKVLGTATDANGLTFGNIFDIKEGQVYDLVYKNKGTEVARTQIFLTKQDKPTVNAYASNTDANTATTVKNAIVADYGISDPNKVVVSSDQKPADGIAEAKTSFTVDGKVITSYVQTLNSQVGIGGPAITPAVTNETVTLTLGAADLDIAAAATKNFVPSLWMGWGPATGANKSEAQKDAAYGNVSISIDGQTPSSILNLSKKITGAEVVEATLGTDKLVVLSVAGGLNSSGMAAVDLDNKTFTYSTDNLSHGYTTVGVDFTVSDAPIAGKTLSQWIDDVRNKKLTSGGTSTEENKLPTNNTSGQLIDTNAQKFTTGTVKASLVVAKDAVDGAVVNAKFEQTSASEGKLTLTGGDALLKGTDTNTLAGQLTVNGSNSGVSFSNKETNGDLVFKVQFNGQVPSTITWKLNGLGSTIDVVTVDAVNFDGEVKPSNTNTNRLDSQFDIEAKFNSTVPTGGTLQLDKLGSLRVTFNDLTNGSHKISTTTTSGKYQGTYAAGIVVSKQPFTVEVRDLKSTSSTSVSFTVDANFLDTADIPKTPDGVIQYSEKTTSGDTTTWSDWKDASSKIEKNDVEEDPITKTVTGLTAGKTYKFRVIYNYNGTPSKVYSNETGEITLPTSSNNNSTITGNGSSSSTTGTSTGSTTINVTTNNSTLTGTSASVNLPTSFRYDSSKTPVAVTFKYKDKDGKVVTETKEQFSNVTAKFNGDKVEVNGLVPGKNYDEITVDYTDNNGRTRSIILRNIQTSTTVESEKYLANVYEVVLSRPADEAGYHFHLDNLKNKKVSLREFLLNMLSEKEFIEKYKSTEEKIEGLYNAIVARSSDEAGKKFWVDEYKKVLAVYGSETTALKAIADRMVNENELKELADKMGVQW